VIIIFVCRKIGVVEGTTANGGQPHAEDKYKKVVVKILMKGPHESPGSIN
jgi:hypothetical protein